MVIAAIKFQSCGYSEFARREFSLGGTRTGASGTQCEYKIRESRRGGLLFFCQKRTIITRGIVVDLFSRCSPFRSSAAF